MHGSLQVDTQTSSTGQGAPDEATSRATSNGPERRSFTLAEIIDGFMASYTGADRGIVTRLAFWKSSLGARNAAEVSADDVADTLAELALARGRTFLGRDKRTGERRFKPPRQRPARCGNGQPILNEPRQRLPLGAAPPSPPAWLRLAHSRDRAR